MLRYFADNPQAADSLEGVARWRLTEETVQRSVQEVADALRWLVEHGYLQEHKTRVSAPIYSVNMKKLSQIQELLANSPLEHP